MLADEYPWQYDWIGLLTAKMYMSVIWIPPWSYDQIGLLTTDLLHICWHGHDGFPWPYDHIGLLTIDQTNVHVRLTWSHWTVNHWPNCDVHWPCHDEYLWPYDDCWPSYNVHIWLAWYCHDLNDQIGQLTTDQTTHSTGLVMMNTYDHIGPLTTEQTVRMSTLDHTLKLGCWPLTKLWCIH